MWHIVGLYAYAIVFDVHCESVVVFGFYLQLQPDVSLFRCEFHCVAEQVPYDAVHLLMIEGGIECLFGMYVT